jgi:hypothetical protein
MRIRIASIARSRRTFIARRYRLGLVFTPPPPPTTCFVVVVVVVVVYACANPIVSQSASVSVSE